MTLLLRYLFYNLFTFSRRILQNSQFAGWIRQNAKRWFWTQNIWHLGLSTKVMTRWITSYCIYPSLIPWYHLAAFVNWGIAVTKLMILKGDFLTTFFLATQFLAAQLFLCCTFSLVHNLIMKQQMSNACRLLHFIIKMHRTLLWFYGQFGCPSNASVADDGKLSIRQMVLCYSTMWKLLRKDLWVTLFKVKLVQPLKPNDSKQKLNEDPLFRPKIMFGDESLLVI